MLDNRTGRVDFLTLRKMSGLHNFGCAFINGEYGIICDGANSILGDAMQPITLSYNNALYTAAIICDTYDHSAVTAQGVLEGYVEEGESFIRSLDFPYALALYDGRCGELMLFKSGRGDKPLFYSIIDGTVCFSTSLRSLFRLFGGCVRIRESVLREHIFGELTNIPDKLFCDITPLRSGQMLLCSRLSDSLVDTTLGACSDSQWNATTAETLRITEVEDVRHCLLETLFCFDYPQFDYLVPYLISAAKNKKANGSDTLTFFDAFEGVCSEYAHERSARIGASIGIKLIGLLAEREKKNARALRGMERELDGILSEYLDSPSCVLHKLADTEAIRALDDEKSIPLRIRRKGMLCQTAMWFEAYNLVLSS